MKYSHLPFLIILVLVLFCEVPLFASSNCSQKSCCKWNTKLGQAFDKYEKNVYGQYEADDADILLPLGYQKMNCILDSIIKKEKYDYNLNHLLWMTFVPDTVFFLSPASLKYLVENKNVKLKNAGRMLVNEKMKKKYSIDKKVLCENKTARDFIEYLIYDHMPCASE